MAATKGSMDCRLYPSAFSSEVVFKVKTTAGSEYAGLAPKHYANPRDGLNASGTNGQVEVKVLVNGGNDARVSTPSGEIITVDAGVVHEK